MMQLMLFLHVSRIQNLKDKVDGLSVQVGADG